MAWAKRLTVLKRTVSKTLLLLFDGGKMILSSDGDKMFKMFRRNQEFRPLNLFIIY